MTYTETLDFLYNALPVFQREGASAYKPGLENTASFSALLGHPDRRFKSVHIAGTNGKGSTAHMLAAILQSAGYRTGLFTSPHLKDFRERIRVNGQMISEQRVVEFAGTWGERMKARRLTFFEMCTLLTFKYFAEQQVDVAVVETGLGGRLDATNIITPALSVITNIGLDHTDLLGNTLPQIATEKAGIIKPGVPAVIGQRDPATDEVFRNKAASAGSPLVFAEDLFRVDRAEPLPDGQSLTVTPEDLHAFTLHTDLAGDYQRHNVVTVLAACRELRRTLTLTDAAIREGCRNVQLLTGLKGRWQKLSESPLIICDTGHNAHGMQEVVQQIARQRYDKFYMILGVVADKDLEAILPLLPPGAHYIFTQPSTPRARNCHSLAAEADRHGLQGDTAPTVAQALALARSLAAPEDMIFIGGSTFTVADVEGL